MTIRTFRQLGQAFGAETANITAKLNDVVVYQGPVTTLNEPYPSLPNLEYKVDNILFSWTVDDVLYTGQQVLEITVDENADLLICAIQANFSPMDPPTPTDPPSKVSSGTDIYIPFTYDQFGNTYVNGQLESVTHGDLTGQWWWRLPPGGTFVENFTILPGEPWPTPA